MTEHIFIRQERQRLKIMAETIKSQQDQELYPKKFLMPIGIQYELTGACNLRCKHCYNRSGDPDIQTRMTPKDWLDLTQHIVEHGGIFQCILSGGEPLLLGESLLEIMDIFNEDKTGFLLISNGVLMDQNWVNRLKKYSFYWVQISIDDSIPEEHDLFRGVPGTWQYAVDAALRISSAGLPLVIAHTLNPGNLNRLPEMVELAYELGANSILCGETLISGRAAANEFLWFNEEKRNLMYSLIQNLREQYTGKINVQYSMPEGVELKTRKTMPNRSVIIRPNGDVRMDCTVPFTLGNVLEEPFVDIWRKKLDCWKNPEVLEYIENLQPGIKNSDYVNHVTKDRKI